MSMRRISSLPMPATDIDTSITRCRRAAAEFSGTTTYSTPRSINAPSRPSAPPLRRLPGRVGVPDVADRPHGCSRDGWIDLQQHGPPIAARRRRSQGHRGNLLGRIYEKEAAARFLDEDLRQWKSDKRQVCGRQACEKHRQQHASCCCSDRSRPDLNEPIGGADAQQRHDRNDVARIALPAKHQRTKYRGSG